MTGNIQYMHFRSINRSNQVDCHGGATVAIMPDDTANIATVAIARVAPGDLFCKKTGRAIATGRLLAAKAGRTALANKIRVIKLTGPYSLKQQVAAELAAEMEEFDLF